MKHCNCKNNCNCNDNELLKLIAIDIAKLKNIIDDILDSDRKVYWNSIINKPDVFPPEYHQHIMEDIIGLNDLVLEVDNKVDKVVGKSLVDNNQITKLKELDTQEQFNERFNDVNSGILGSVNTTQTIGQLNALPDGIYEAENSGTYANGLVVESGYYTKFKKSGTTWTISSKVQLAESTQKLKNFETGKFYKANEVYLVNDASGESEFRVKPTVTGGETSQWASDGAADWTRVGSKGREDTFNIDASNANLLTFYNSIQDFYIVDSDDSAKAQDFLVNSVWVNSTTVNSQVGAFGLQIQRLNETPINFGVSIHRTSEDLEVGKVFELRPVGGSASYKVYVKLKTLIPSSTSFLQNHIGRIFNTSALQFKNIVNVSDLVNLTNTVIDPKVYSNKTASEWFKLIKNIWIYDSEYKKGDVYSLGYIWLNDSLGKFGLQVTKNGANNSNFTIRETPLSGGTYKLDFSSNAQPLKSISIVVEFNNFTDFPTLSGLIPYTSSIFGKNSFKFNTDKNIENLLGANKLNYKINKITVTRNANDYLSIRETIMNIADASEGNRYEVYVPEGDWFELDIQTKKWVSLILHDKANIYCDGTSTDPKYTIPSNYPYPSEVGKQISTVDYSLLHTLWAKGDYDIRGKGTVQIKRGKYAFHIDSNTFNDGYAEYITFKSEQALHPIGMGGWENQYPKFKRCIIKSSDSKFGVGFHNWNNRSAGSYVEFDECFFDGCSYVKLDELGSTQKDYVRLINCNTNVRKVVRYSVSSADGTNSYYKDSGNLTTNNPLNVPYNLNIIAVGTNIEEIEIGSTGWSAYPNAYTRDIGKILENSSINGYEKCIASGVILKGDIVSVSGTTVSKLSVSKYNGDSSNVPYGIAVSDSENGFVWVAVKGKITDALVTGLNLSIENRRKLTYSGGLVSTPTAKHYEVIAEAVEISLSPFIKVKLI